MVHVLDGFDRCNLIVIVNSCFALHLFKELSSGEAKSGGIGGAFEGLDAFAATIESVLCRVRVALVDTVVRLEVADEEVGQALELHVAEIEFYDQLGKGAGEDATGYWESPAFLTKVFTAGQSFDM